MPLLDVLRLKLADTEEFICILLYRFKVCGNYFAH